MKQTIRLGVFETNSSSVHTLTICTVDEYNKWKNGDLLYDSWNDEFVENRERSEDDDYRTYDEFFDDYYLECYEQDYTTPGGEKIVVFGKYGYDN